MPTAVRVLIVEDNSADVELILRTLREGGYEPIHQVVETRSAFRDAIATQVYDIVLSDQRLPRFDGLSALALLRDSGLDIPFIIVSGTVGEESAVSAMKAGVSDVVLKDNLGRLVPSVNRELREIEERRGRRRAEEALQRREEQLRLALNAARMGTWDWDLRTDAWAWSDHAEVILHQAQRSPPPPTRTAYLALVPEEDQATVTHAINEAIENRTDYQVAHRIITGDGRVRWLGMKGRVYEEHGAPVRMSGTVADITDRKEAEAALIESEQRYRDLYEEAPVALFSINRNGDLVRANREAAGLFGFDARALLGRTALDLFAATPHGRDRMKTLLDQLDQGGVVLDEPVQLERPGEAPWWGNISVKPVFNTQGEMVVLRATLVDITARRAAEQLLQLSQRAIDQSPDLIVICDRDYRYRRVNEAHLRAHALQESEVVGKRIPMIISDEVFESEIKHRYDACLAGQEVAFELWANYPAVGKRCMELSYTPLRTSKGEVEGVIIIGRDITQRRRAEDRRESLEAQLRQAHKMEALGTLAGGIAHDFNNLLLAILGYGELVREAVGTDRTLADHVDQILAAGERAQSMVEKILQFGRQTEQEMAHIAVTDVVKEVVGFLNAMLPSSVTVDATLSPGSCYVLGDSSQVHQVILNLGVNSLHAMREHGGRLAIDVSSVVLNTEEAGRAGGLLQGKYVRITVRDTGHGMAPEVRDRIYDPFFTTKGPGEGTGLGLSVVHGIVLSHGGGLTVDSEPGVGTTFRVFLPQTRGKKRASQDGAEAVRGAGERVLFIDDERPIATLGKELLERLGYSVTAVTAAQEGIRLFDDDPATWDIVVTDQTMPGHTGLDVVRHVRADRPDIPVIITTGFSEAVTSEALQNQGVNALVMKPYAGAELGRAVRRALDEAGGESP